VLPYRVAPDKKTKKYKQKMSKNINIQNFNSRKEWEEYLWLEMIKNIKNTRDVKRVKNFLESILTESERQDIIKRFMTIMLIKNGMSYRNIGKILWVSPTTIRQAKINLENKYQKYRSRHDLKKAKQKIIQQNTKNGAPESPLLDWLESLPAMPTRSGKGRWNFIEYFKN
jgi:Trp operon repressor